MQFAVEWLPHARSNLTTEHVQVSGQVATTPHARSIFLILACEHVCLHVHVRKSQFPPLYDSGCQLRRMILPYARDIAMVQFGLWRHIIDCFRLFFQYTPLMEGVVGMIILVFLLDLCSHTALITLSMLLY